ncbi:MAG: hypothetical protein RBQ64_02015 [Candidatus Izemoplasmatales bacterium]|jgi:hypothetical protein|nr:hypothetical protein [Candidatus Izemoplasmatales bacterium]
MKKLILIIAMSLFLTGCGFNFTQTTTEPIVVDTENYLEITTVEELKNIEMNKSYILMNDLDLQDEEWIPLGSYNQPFRGDFNGNGFEISNLTITQEYIYTGLFGYVEGNIYNLTVKDFSINYTTERITFVGGLAGNSSGNVEDVFVNGTINVINNDSNTYAGLLLGQSSENSYSGNIANFLPNEITDNQANGALTIVSERITFVGGLIGKVFNSKVTGNFSDTTIDVTSTEDMANVGGLIGHNYGGITAGYEIERKGKDIAVANNIAFSHISVESLLNNAYIGGLIGYNNFGDNRDNFADTSISAEGLIISAGLLIGEDWYSENKDSVARGSLNLTSENISMSAYIGQIYGNSLLLNSYFESQDQQFSEEKNQVSFENILDSSWYVSNLEWDMSFINKIIDELE